MSRASAFVAGLAATVVVCGLWFALTPPTKEDLLVNRAWAERMPRDRKDMVTWFVPLDMNGKKFGIAEQMSHFAFAGERFVYTRDGGRLTLSFQQTGRKMTLDTKVRDCKGTAPQGFDLCLDLTAGGERVTFYSKRSWTIPNPNPKADELPGFDLRPVEPGFRELPEVHGLDPLLSPGR